jgi:hypothetical protein
MADGALYAEGPDNDLPGFSLSRLMRCLYETKFNSFIRECTRAGLCLCASASERHRAGKLTAKFGYQHAVERAAAKYVWRRVRSELAARR